MCPLLQCCCWSSSDQAIPFFFSPPGKFVEEMPDVWKLAAITSFSVLAVVLIGAALIIGIMVHRRKSHKRPLRGKTHSFRQLQCTWWIQFALIIIHVMSICFGCHQQHNLCDNTKRKHAVNRNWDTASLPLSKSLWHDDTAGAAGVNN